MKHASLILYFIVSGVINYVNGYSIITHCNDVPGYYWRDYIGEVPGDAVPGGNDSEGRTTYIGQTLHPGGSILPGKISEDKQAMFYGDGGGERSSIHDVKILCSQHPEKLQWVSTKNGRSVTSVGFGKTLISSGRDGSNPLVIGRKPIETGGVTVARVRIVDYNFEKIYLADNGKGWTEDGPYEVLVYNPLGSVDDPTGYYWRDYTGEVPSDAIPGGTDPKGKTTYIGQTLHPGGSILPGKISEEKQAMFYEHGSGERSSTEDVKILCSQHPEKLQWMSTKSGLSLTSVGVGKTLIFSGHDSSRPLAIGRKTISTGELTVSKVLIVNYNFDKIYLADNGKGWSEDGPYEVLVYNPSGSVDDHNVPHSDKELVAFKGRLWWAPTGDFGSGRAIARNAAARIRQDVAVFPKGILSL